MGDDDGIEACSTLAAMTNGFSQSALAVRSRIRRGPHVRWDECLEARTTVHKVLCSEAVEERENCDDAAKAD